MFYPQGADGAAVQLERDVVTELDDGSGCGRGAGRVVGGVGRFEHLAGDGAAVCVAQAGVTQGVEEAGEVLFGERPTVGGTFGEARRRLGEVLDQRGRWLCG